MTHAPLVSHDARQALHDPRRHLATLTRLSIERLAAGDAFTAFMFADRRCRLGTAFAHDLVLRSEALRRLGFTTSAKADLARAADLDPTDPFISHRLIEDGEEAGAEAARWVVSHPRSSRALVDAAVQLLVDRGHPVVGSLTVDGDRVTGWIAGGEQRSLALSLFTAEARADVPVRSRGPRHRMPVDIRLRGRLSHAAVEADGRPATTR